MEEKKVFLRKTVKVLFKNGAIMEVPYSSKFYTALVDNMGKDFKAEHPSSTINTKDVQAVVYHVEEVEE